MNAIEFKKQYKPYYSPKPGKPELVTVPAMQFVCVDGSGFPEGSEEFQNAVGALYSTVYGLKFGRKKAGIEPDFTIGALEGLWWAKTGRKFEMGKEGDWVWTLMIWVPDFITQKDIKEIIDIQKAKKPNPALDKVRLTKFIEGKCVQIMHIGPYSEELGSINLMHDFAQEQGYEQSCKHHEIYFGDPRRTAPERLKTILRHPLRKSKQKASYVRK